MAQHPEAAQRYPDMHRFAREIEKVAAALPQTVRGRGPPVRRARPLLWSGFLLLILADSLLAGLFPGQHMSGAPAARSPLSPQALHREIIHTRPTLENPSAGQWIEQHDRSGGSCSLSGTTLSLVSPNRSSSEVDCILNQVNASNFTLQAEMQSGQADPGQDNRQACLFFRTLYAYFTRPSMNVHVSLVPSHQCTSIPPAPSRRPARVQTCAVIALDYLFYLYINQVYVTAVSDTRYRSGSLGVFLLNAASAPGQLAVSFTNVRVWLLQESVGKCDFHARNTANAGSKCAWFLHSPTRSSGGSTL